MVSLVEDRNIPFGVFERLEHIILLGKIDRGDDQIVLLPDLVF